MPLIPRHAIYHRKYEKKKKSKLCFLLFFQRETPMKPVMDNIIECHLALKRGERGR